MNNLVRSVAGIAVMAILVACSDSEPPVETRPVTTVETTETVEPAPVNEPKTIVSQSVTLGPTPAWYNKRDLPAYPESRRDETRNGIEYLLLDDQYRYDEGGYEYVSRMAFRVSDRKGLETAAQIQRSFDPSLSEMTFNSILVTRDDKTVDRLPKAEIRELQQESGLGKGIIDGDVTALVNLEDIRVGDIIDFTYSVKMRTPLYPDKFFATASTTYGVPVAASYESYDMPRDKRLYSDVLKSDIRVKITDQDDRTVYSFDLIDPDPHRSFSNIPDGIITQGSVQVSTETSWESIADWAVGVYDIDLTLPKPAKAKIKSIKRAHKSDADRMLAALQWVQDDVRYLGFEEGVNGHRPRTPAVTLSNGYGDCKDKSLLLKTALAELGIESYVSLASTTSGDLLDQVLPSIGMFNHAIVMAELDGRTVYLDPTGTYQRGDLDNYSEPDYGHVLPIRSGQTELVKVDIPLDAYPLQTISETYIYEDDGSISFTVKSRFNKGDADSVRRKLAKNGLASLTESYHDYYAERYPGLEVVDTLKAEDRAAENVIVLSESYRLPAEVVKDAEYDQSIEVKAYTISGNLPDFIEPGRDFPLGLSQGTKLRHEIHIITPGREFPDQADQTEEVDGLDFELDYKSEGETFSLIYTLSIAADRVGLADAKEVVELAGRIDSLASRSVNLKFAKAPLHTQLGMDTAVPEDVMVDLREIAGLIKKKENKDALEKVRKLSKSYTKKDPLRGYIQSLQGAVLIDLDRSNAAKPYLKEAFSLYDPLEINTYFSYVGLLYEDKDLPEAANVLQRLFVTHPEASSSLRYEWFWRFYRDLRKDEHLDAADDLMIALAKAQLENLDEIEPIDRVFGSAVLAMGRKGLVEDAKALYPNIHYASTYRDILMDREMQDLWDDVAALAGDGLGKARAAEVEYAKTISESDEATYLDHVRLITAYLGNGQAEEAIAFSKPLYDNWDRIIAEGEDGFWFVNGYAEALEHDGQHEASDAVLEKLMSIGLAQESSLVSMGLNQMTQLVRRGDFREALEKVALYEENDDFVASDFGMAYLWFAKSCAQYQLGQKDEAAKTFDEKMLPIMDDNAGAKTLLLTCLEREDDVAEALIARLENEAERRFVLPVFTTGTIPLDPDGFGQELSDRLAKVAARPDVQAAFKKYGRSIKIDGPSEVWAEF